jgi:hypothetical protein
MSRVRVVVERGRVVGAQVVQDPPAGQPGAVLREGPGQKVHMVDIEMPAELANARQIEAFHAALGRQLKAKKKPARKARR